MKKMTIQMMLPHMKEVKNNSHCAEYVANGKELLNLVHTKRYVDVNDYIKEYSEDDVKYIRGIFIVKGFDSDVATLRMSEDLVVETPMFEMDKQFVIDVMKQ